MNIACSYHLRVLGSQSVSDLTDRMAAVPVDLTLPNAWGLRYSADATSAVGTVITRTISFSTTPTSAATATTSLDAGNRGSPVLSIAVGAAGGGYAALPICTVVGAANRVARVQPVMGMSDVLVIKGGSGWTPGVTTVSFSGGGVGVQQASATVSVSGGAIASLTIIDAGNGYTIPPNYTLVGTGTGAVLSPGLKVNDFFIVDPGMGYETAPTVSIDPLFTRMFPTDNVDSQMTALASFMTTVFEAALNAPISTSAPVIS